jgi:hypothetical protein
MIFWHAMEVNLHYTAIHKLTVHINTSIDLMLTQKAKIQFYDGIIATHHLMLYTTGQCQPR